MDELTRERYGAVPWRERKAKPIALVPARTIEPPDWATVLERRRVLDRALRTSLHRETPVVKQRSAAA